MEKLNDKVVIGNKGEWSEFYVFLKLIDERKLFSADENLAIIRDLSYPVLKIFRDESLGSERVYDLEASDHSVNIADLEGNTLAVVDTSNLKKRVREIFEGIFKAKKQNAFPLKAANDLLLDFQCLNIKAGHSRKSDIVLTIKDGIRVEPKIGYSIKSMIGSAATLLNASGATNFIYEIVGLDDRFDQQINETKRFKEKTNLIYENGGAIKFVKVNSDIFKNNLQLIDNTFHQVLAEFLLNFYEGKGKTFEEILKQLNQDRIALNLNVPAVNYRFKIKQFLINIALGMVPNSEWDAYTKAHGGYIIVKKDGEICCYQLNNRDKFQDYLYNNVKFDTPSTTKFKFGKVYSENGKKYIKLNLQIRFLK